MTVRELTGACAAADPDTKLQGALVREGNAAATAFPKLDRIVDAELLS